MYEKDVTFTRQILREYTTIAALRAEGLTSTECPDAKVKYLIRLMSAVVDKMTNQWFSPVEAAFRFDGGDKLIRMYNSVKILELTNPVTVIHQNPLDEDSEIEEEFESGDYAIAERFIKKTYGKWPKGVRNIIVRGVFGWLEQARDKVETTLTTALVTNAVEAVVTDVTGFVIRDLVQFYDDVNMVQAIITDIDYTNKKLKFDSVWSIPTLAIGSKARTWGAVPVGIERIVQMLVMKYRAKLSEGQGGALAGRIKSEDTDNYSYSLFDNAADVISDVTGDPLFDGLIDEYTDPTICEVI